jgi:serine/threonine-protein kinase
VAVDSRGTIYVTACDITDADNSQVLKFAAGSSTKEVLPFTGLKFPSGVAVDSTGTLYVTDSPPNNRVLKLPVG